MKFFSSDKPSVDEIIISSANHWLPNFFEIWKYRLVLISLIQRNIKLRYKQTILGVLWVIIQPLALSGVFAIIFGKFMSVSVGNIPYLAFALSGVSLWQFFSRSVVDSSVSLVTFSSIITKVYFPRILIPLASIFTALFDLILIFPLLVMVIWLVNGPIPLHSLWILPSAIFMTLIMVAGLGFLLSSLNVLFRDVQHIIPFALQLGLYLSPIVYASDTIPEKWQTLYYLNPMVGVIEVFRYGLFQQTPLPNPNALVMSLGISVLLIVIGCYVFNKTEKMMIDRI